MSTQIDGKEVTEKEFYLDNSIFVMTSWIRTYDAQNNRPRKIRFRKMIEFFRLNTKTISIKNYHIYMFDRCK